MEGSEEELGLDPVESVNDILRDWNTETTKPSSPASRSKRVRGKSVGRVKRTSPVKGASSVPRPDKESASEQSSRCVMQPLTSSVSIIPLGSKNSLIQARLVDHLVVTSLPGY